MPRRPHEVSVPHLLAKPPEAVAPVQLSGSEPPVALPSFHETPPYSLYSSSVRMKRPGDESLGQRSVFPGVPVSSDSIVMGIQTRRPDCPAMCGRDRNSPVPPRTANHEKQPALPECACSAVPSARTISRFSASLRSVTCDSCDRRRYERAAALLPASRCGA
jgi:hypothetical protein